ncbi:MAG TPA: hypothetical protein VMV10_03700 [Pirellulales bacterium]|nr:hypothetical protein [Pirellulales bacterium]
MPCISSCPACHRDLTVADQADPQRRLRCPLCSAEFPAAEILADGVPFPPAAIEIEAEAAAQSPEAPLSEAQSPAVPEAEPPHGEVPPPSAESAQTAENLEPAAAESEAPAEEQQELVEPAEQPAYAVRSAPRPKAATSTLGLFGHFVGMALGGVLGLAIGYYVLLWVGGPQADFLELRDKLPAWMLPAKRAKRERSDARRGVSRGEADRRSLADLLDEPGESGPHESEPAEPASTLDAPIEAAQLAAAQRNASAAPGNAEFANPVSFDSLADKPASGAVEEAAPKNPASSPRAAAEIALGPRGFNAYTADDLWAALAKAGDAIGCEHCHSTGYVLREPPAGAKPGVTAEGQRSRCPHCHGKPVRGLTAEAFDRLCELADTVTFAQLAPDNAERERLREQLVEALLQVADDRGKAQIIGRLAGARLDDSQRLTNGIALAGTVQAVAAEGPLYRIQLVLLGVPRTVVVYSRQPPEPAFSPADRVLILGSIVDSPSDNLAGYRGNLTQVVWGGLPLKLAPAGK